ncbi:MAG: helix-turn-helix domain-containing protein [Propionibacteriaceae bacterium]|nr:helix-turn-helix domain-containing protein [Propionibacteriaceae bacterium]
MSNLNDVEAAKQAYDEAELAYKRTIADAINGGIPLAKVARVTGVTRQTIYNWLEWVKEQPEG